MKKFLTILSVIALACACTKNEESDPVVCPVVGDQQLTITASTEADTRIESADGLQFNFKTDDQIGLFFFDDNDALVAENVCFKVASVDAGKATFEKVGSLTADELAKAAKVYAYYPYADGKTIDENGKLAFEIPAVQTQTAKGDFTHLYDAYTMVSARTAIAKNDESASVDLKFSGIFSLVRFNVSNGSEDTVALKSIVMTAEDGHLAGNFAVDTKTDPAFSGINVGIDKSYTDPLIVTETSDSNSNTITVAFKEAVEVAANESVMLYGLVYANNSSTEAVTTYANPNIVATTTTDDEYTLTKSVAKYILPRNQRTTFKMPLNGDDKVVARIDGKGYSSLNDAIKAANGNKQTITLLKGNTFANLPGSMSNITFDGGNAEDVTIDITTSSHDNTNVTFKNVTLAAGNEFDGEKGFGRAKGLKFQNCIITGMMLGYSKTPSDTVTYDGCTFVQDKAEYNMWTYAASVTYKNCTFKGYGKFLHVCNAGNTETYTIDVQSTCKFISLGDANKAAVNIKTIPTPTATSTFLHFKVKIAKSCKFEGNFPTTNGGLWQIDNPYNGLQDVSVVVASKEVYKVGEIAVSSADALENVLNAKGCTAVVSSDLTFNAMVSVKSTLKLENNCQITTESTAQTILAGKGSNLTIQGEGTITGSTTGKGNTAAIWVATNGTVNITDNNTTIVGGGNTQNLPNNAHPCILIYYGTVNISGGHFIAQQDLDANGEPTGYNACVLLYADGQTAATRKATLNISGGVFDNGGFGMLINVNDGANRKDYNIVNITGGIFIGFDPSVGDSGAGIATFVAKGYKSQETTYEGKQAWEVVPDTTTAE